VVKNKETDYLVTNWHVLTHKSPDSGECFSSEGNIPTVVNISHHGAEAPNKWITQGEQLFVDSTLRWIEKKRDAEKGYIDIAALPLKDTPPRINSIELFPLDLSSIAREEEINPGMVVYIIGYLEGMIAGDGWPIWITGHIASDPSLDYCGRPVYLINASTGGGLSGAPVFIEAKGIMKFIGVHSSGVISRHSGGRVEGMGEVWKASLIDDILNSHK